MLDGSPSHEDPYSWRGGNREHGERGEGEREGGGNKSEDNIIFPPGQYLSPLVAPQSVPSSATAPAPLSSPLLLHAIQLSFSHTEKTGERRGESSSLPLSLSLSFPPLSPSLTVHMISIDQKSMSSFLGERGGERRSGWVREEGREGNKKWEKEDTIHQYESSSE